MTDVLEGTETQAWSANETGEVSAGTLLRRARQAAGLHVAALAVSLKIPVRKLEALEEDRFDEMPDAVFVRGLAASVCRALKIDPQPVLDRLPQSTAPRLIRDTDGLNTPFRAPGDDAAPGWLDRVRQPVPLAVLGLLLAAVVVMVWPNAQKDVAPVAAIAVEPVQAQPVAAPEVPAASDVAPTPLPSASNAAAGLPTSAPAGDRSAVASAVVPVTAAPASKSSASAVAPAASAANVAEATATTGPLMIRARGETWVEVIDAKGLAVVRKLLATGESVGASGTLPLQVTIGRAHLTDVVVRGKPFDMRPVSRDDVARFEVK